MSRVHNNAPIRGKTAIAGGVCAGLAKHYGLRKGGVQAVFLLGTLIAGVPALIYLVLWWILDKET